jgi:ankyrin repeat protein
LDIGQVDQDLENILHKAVRAEHLAAVKFLVEGKFKLNVNAFNKSMQTPLQLAIATGSINIGIKIVVTRY